MNGDEINGADPSLLVDLEHAHLPHHNRDIDVLAKVIETITASRGNSCRRRFYRLLNAWQGTTLR